MSAGAAGGAVRGLRALIEGPDLSFLMEAHDALSAAIAERSGFKGLWASGLSIASTSLPAASPDIADL